MAPLPFVFPYALLFWTVDVWAFAPEFGIVRRARRNQTAADSKSLQVILFGMSLALFLSYPLAWVRALQFAPASRAAAFYGGIAIMIAGALLRRHCFRMLGASFTGDVQARADQEIVQRGAYSILRHPSYSAGVLLNIGVGVALGSWGSVALLAVVSIAVYSYRIAVEERRLLTVIGEPYRQFIATRKRLVPFVY